MKKLAVVLSIILSTSHTMRAQNVYPASMTKSELEAAKNRLALERDAIFLNALHLSISQASDFGPIYNQYTEEKKKLDNELITLMMDYFDEYEHGDKTFIRNFITRSEKYQKKELKLRKRYFKIVSREVSIQTAAEFYELDDFCGTVLRLNILTNLPFTSRFIQN